MKSVRNEVPEQLRVVLQPRDLEIFKWILEMGAANVDLLKDYFGDLGIGKSADGVRKRVKRLVTNDYLRETFGYDGTKRIYYLVSKKAADEVFRKNMLDTNLGANSKISPNSFSHDLGVANCRGELEKSGRASDWISKRVLRSKYSNFKEPHQIKVVPDGIFRNNSGVLCAFEFELANKTYKKYEEGVKKHLETMKGKDSIYSHCLYVTSSEFSYKSLRQITEQYRDLFQVQRNSEITTKDSD